VCCGEHQQDRLERPCRYIRRPAIANERLSRNAKGQAVLHLIRFHWVLAPNARLRAQVVPQGRDWDAGSAQAGQCETREAPQRSDRMSWARLLKRVFDIDIERCPNCEGELRIIAAIEEPGVIGRILTHLGYPRETSKLPGSALSGTVEELR
jgi:hypothetical protein